MANPLTTFLNAIIGRKSGNETDKEIEEANRKGEMVARNAAKRMGVVEPVEINAEVARQAAELKAKSTVGKDGERTN